MQNVLSETTNMFWVYVTGSSIIVLIIGCAVLGSILNARKSKKNAQLKAKTKKSEAASGVAAMSRPLLTLGESIDGLGGKVDDNELAALRLDLTNLEDFKSRINARYQQVSNETSDPEDDQLKKADYEHATSLYGEVVIMLKQFEEGRKELDDKVKKLVRVMASVGTELTALATSATETETAINGAHQAGFRVEGFNTRLTSAKAEVERAKTLVHEKKFTDASDLIQRVKDNLYQIRTEVGDLERRKAALANAVTDLKSRLATVRGSTRQVTECFNRIRANYAQSCWRAVEGHSASIEAALGDMANKIVEVEAAANMTEQRWQDAETAAAKASEKLIEANSLTKAVTDLEQQLITAQRTATAEILTAKEKISNARRFVNEHSEDLESNLTNSLCQATSDITLAEEERAHHQPSLLEVLQLAKKAGAEADRVLVQAQDQHHRAEANRQRVRGAIQGAEATVNEAARYMAAYPTHKNLEALRLLREARSKLEEARDRYSNERQERIDYANEARNLAVSALARMRQTVRAADIDDGGAGAFAAGAVTGAIFAAATDDDRAVRVEPVDVDDEADKDLGGESGY